MRLGDLVVLATQGQLSQDQIETLRALMNNTESGASLAASWVGSNPGTIDPPTSFVAGAGNVILDVSGIKIYNNSILTGWFQNDGDHFIGSDLSSPDTTTLSLFSNGQTYGGEVFGAGDALFGSNSSGYANLLWDVSDKQLKFRGGTTVQAYVGTDGVIYAGGGNLHIDHDGIKIIRNENQGAQPSYGFEATDGLSSGYCGLYSVSTGTNVNLYIRNTDTPTTGDTKVRWMQLLNFGNNASSYMLLRTQNDLTGDNSSVTIYPTYASMNAPNMLFSVLTTGIRIQAGNIINEFSIDGTMAGNSDTALPTEKAIVSYVSTHSASILQIQMFS